MLLWCNQRWLGTQVCQIYVLTLLVRPKEITSLLHLIYSYSVETQYKLILKFLENSSGLPSGPLLEIPLGFLKRFYRKLNRGLSHNFMLVFRRVFFIHFELSHFFQFFLKFLRKLFWNFFEKFF